ncbi:MAG: hypothetical protein AMXMBFR58_01330 [Phycisphaerae bacterium]
MPTDADTPLPDLACVECGYNLLGLASSGRCPECGTPVEHSIDSTRLLRNAPVRWLRNVERGVRLMFASIALTVGGFLLVAVLLSLLTIAADHYMSSLVDPLVWIVIAFAAVISIACSLGFVAACWFLSSLPHTGPAPASWARASVRWGGPTCLLLVLFGDYVLTFLSLPIGSAVRLIATVVLGFFLFGLLLICEHLERRSAARLESRTSSYRRSLFFMGLLVTIAGIGPLLAVGEWIMSGSNRAWSLAGLAWIMAGALMYFIPMLQSTRDAVWIEHKVAIARRRTHPPQSP